MRRYLRIFALYFQHVFQYRGRTFVWLLVALINPLVLLLFWKGIAEGGGNFGEWTYENINSYYLLLIAAQAFLMQHVELQVTYDIYRGELVRDLLKPFPYLHFRLLAEAPWRLLQGFFSILTIALLIFLLNRPITLFAQTEQIGYVVIVLINAYFLSFFFKMILGFFAFWMTNIYGLLEMNDVLTILLSGLIMPLNLLPQWIQQVAAFTPYPYILYYPVSAMIGVLSQTKLQEIIVIQFIWIASLYVVYQIMWSRGIKQFTGVGQ